MAIYKQDVVVANGKVVSGERVDGPLEMRLPYRMASSITSDGKTYYYSRMDAGEAVYEIGSALVLESPKKLKEMEFPPQEKAVGDGANVLTELPEDAILHGEFVGRHLNVGGQRYRLYRPVSKYKGMYVYVLASKGESS